MSYKTHVNAQAHVNALETSQGANSQAGSQNSTATQGSPRTPMSPASPSIYEDVTLTSIDRFSLNNSRVRISADVVSDKILGQCGYVVKIRDKVIPLYNPYVEDLASKNPLYIAKDYQSNLEYIKGLTQQYVKNSKSEISNMNLDDVHDILESLYLFDKNCYRLMLCALYAHNPSVFNKYMLFCFQYSHERLGRIMTEMKTFLQQQAKQVKADTETNQPRYMALTDIRLYDENLIRQMKKRLFNSANLKYDIYLRADDMGRLLRQQDEIDNIQSYSMFKCCVFNPFKSYLLRKARERHMNENVRPEVAVHHEEAPAEDGRPSKIVRPDLSGARPTSNVVPQGQQAQALPQGRPPQYPPQDQQDYSDNDLLSGYSTDF